MSQARVLIVSAHPLFSEGIIRLLAGRATVVGAAADWQEALAIDPQPRPHVIIVDHGDADLTETDLAPLLWPEVENLRVVYVTLAGDRMTIHERQQVSGAGEDDLLRALRTSIDPS